MVDQPPLQERSTSRPVALECLFSVLREISEAASDSEVAGLLLGTRDETGVRVLAFRRLVPKRPLGRSGGLSDTDRDAVARLIAGPPAEGELYGLEPLGWFRAQPRRDLTLSDWELDLLNEFFPEPRQLGMVLRSVGPGPARARFYVREDGNFPVNTYRELIVPETAETHMLAIERHTARHYPAIRPPIWPPQTAPEAAGPSAPSRRPWRSWVWRAVSVFATTAAVIGYWLISVSKEHAQPRTTEQVAGLANRQSHSGLAEAADIGAADRTTGDLADIGRSADTWDKEEDDQFARRIADLTKQLKELEQQNPNLQGLAGDLPKSSDPESAPAGGIARGGPGGHNERAGSATEPTRKLRPLPQISPAPPDAKPAELAPPPVVGRDVAHVDVPVLPQSITMAAPVKPAPKKPPAVVPSGPSNGTLIWTGRLRRNATVILDGKNASFGALVGGLPGRPIQYSVYPGDLTDSGIVVFTASTQDARRGWDPPGPQNGWNRVTFELDPRTASGVEIEEAPSPANGWKRMVLRCTNPKLAVIYVKWSVTQ